MNRRVWTATPLLTGLLVLALGAPCAITAADDPAQAATAGEKPAGEKTVEKKPPEMSPEARILPDPPGPESFGPQPEYPQPYDPVEELAIYGGKHMNPTAFPPLDLGLQLYE